MKKNATDLLLFLLGILAVHFGILWVFQNVILADSIWTQGQQQYENRTAAIETLILGDSHMAMGVDVAVLDSAFNFASPGENYVESYYKLRYVLEQSDPPPKRIVMSIDHHAFTTKYTQEFGRNYYWGRYLDYARIDRGNSGIFTGIGMYLMYKIPYISGANDLFVRFLRSQQPEVRDGHIVSDKNFADVQDRQTIAEQKSRQFFRGTELVDDGAIEYMQKIVRLARQNGIEVFLVRTPVTQEYFDASSRYVGLLMEFYAPIEQAAHEAGDVTILDFHALWLDRPEMFSDEDHLNATGSRMFTQRLAVALEAADRGRERLNSR